MLVNLNHVAQPRHALLVRVAGVFTQQGHDRCVWSTAYCLSTRQAWLHAHPHALPPHSVTNMDLNMTWAWVEFRSLCRYDQLTGEHTLVFRALNKGSATHWRNVRVHLQHLTSEHSRGWSVSAA